MLRAPRSLSRVEKPKKTLGFSMVAIKKHCKTQCFCYFQSPRSLSRTFSKPFQKPSQIKTSKSSVCVYIYIYIYGWLFFHGLWTRVSPSPDINKVWNRGMKPGMKPTCQHKVWNRSMKPLHFDEGMKPVWNRYETGVWNQGYETGMKPGMKPHAASQRATRRETPSHQH